eukprot:CAMPEP_0204153318 /NCGR_PEP_ID=MMETSP0361-20130328/27755_1 /ASSEMBLY_ACC=CAM_ASM_000343 /TAXON_ID=268821 /ORGANISM="Scrippsiella Hangoei, Strain SHTV-5" /LENGTH=193 /DNA_ID=CAMNT_0051108423 /DNA_START=583 /DNA_END=1164 /DNA_ORIENTATION=-
MQGLHSPVAWAADPMEVTSPWESIGKTICSSSTYSCNVVGLVGLDPAVPLALPPLCAGEASAAGAAACSIMGVLNKPDALGAGTSESASRAASRDKPSPTKSSLFLMRGCFFVAASLQEAWRASSEAERREETEASVDGSLPSLEWKVCMRSLLLTRACDSGLHWWWPSSSESESTMSAHTVGATGTNANSMI